MKKRRVQKLFIVAESYVERTTRLLLVLAFKDTAKKMDVLSIPT